MHFAITNLSRNTYALLQTPLGPHDKYDLCTHNSHFNATLTSAHMTVHVVGGLTTVEVIIEVGALTSITNNL
jgi:hypothetical protein